MRSRRRTWFLSVAVVSLVISFLWAAGGVEESGASAAEAEPVQRKISYSRDVQPILAEACFTCHGFDREAREGDLRIDQAADAFADRGGYAAIVPGNPIESEVYFRMTEEHPADRMPPEDHHYQPTDEEIEIVRQWIEQGAEYEGHWSFIPPVKPELPEVSNTDWPRNAIDQFVLAKLEEEGLQPSPEADRATLIRRVTLDLTGLPPTTEEVDAFVNDTSADAYEKVVDRLLASPRYGEHMARFWLDAVRYGDTHGLHLDNYREMWPYRDWVINAFNNNMPFDQFTTEQLAGDLLPDPTLEQQVATGFLRAHVTTNEGGSIVDEVFMRNVADRSDTTSTVFLGLTMGCAQCHDHKYDPITIDEYYSFFAFFNSLDGSPMDGNAAQHPPIARVPSQQQQHRLAELDAAVNEEQLRLAERENEAADDLTAWLATAPDQLATEHANVYESATARFKLNEGSGQVATDATSDIEATINGQNVQWEHENVPGTEPALKFDGYTYVEAEGVGDFERDQPLSYGAWVHVSGGGAATVMSRMDTARGHRGWDMYLTERRVMVHLLHNWDDNALRLNTTAQLQENTWQHVMVTYDGSSKAEGVTIYINGEPAEVQITHNTLTDTIRTNDVNFRIGQRTEGTPLRNAMVSDVTLFGTELSQDQVASIAGSRGVTALLAIAPDERSDEQNQKLREHYFKNVDGPSQAIRDELETLRQERKAIADAVPSTLVYKETAEPRQAHIMQRGMYDAPGEPVERGVPDALPQLPEDAPADRLGLAKWLLSDQQPLTSRVTVNRYWQQLFGTGIVETSEDFGVQGAFPSHPDLLDHLAVTFREEGWDVKNLMRQMVLSSTYRQTSRRSPELHERDPENRLLARGPRFRLDGEVLRDQALALSGLLVEEIGGPGVKPPQPEGLWEAVGYSSSNTSNFKADTSREDIHRRSIYTFWKRTSPPPQMTVFDAPSRESCIVRRERTNTPLQALAVMNDVQFVEPARALAERALLEAGDSAEERARWMFRHVTARNPVPMEHNEVLGLYEAFAQEYADNAERAQALVQIGTTEPAAELDTAELAAWTMVANLLLNLDEVINKG